MSVISDESSGGGFTPGAANRIPFGNAGGTALTDHAGFTWNAGSFTLFGQSANARLQMNDSAGSQLFYTNNVSLGLDGSNITLTAVQNILANAMHQYRVLAAAAAATLDPRGYNGLRISSGSTALDHVRSDTAREGTLLWIASDVAVNLNHNTGSPPANHSPLINASGAANVMAAGHVRLYMRSVAGWTEIRLS
jgi:hypothetical protein